MYQQAFEYILVTTRAKKNLKDLTIKASSYKIHA